MRVTRLTLSALLLTATAVLWSCSDASLVAPLSLPAPAVSPLSSPASSVSPVPLGGPPPALGARALSGLLRCAALRPATRSRIIGPRGGTIEIGPHKLVIPAGALSSPVTITVVIKSENVNRIHFEPDGLEFAQPAILTMSYGNCGKGVPGLPGGRGGRAPVYRIVYVSPTLDIIQSLLSIDDGRNRVVSATLEYLASDYAVDDTAYSDHATWW